MIFYFASEKSQKFDLCWLSYLAKSELVHNFILDGCENKILLSRTLPKSSLGARSNQKCSPKEKLAVSSFGRTKHNIILAPITTLAERGKESEKLEFFVVELELELKLKWK